MLSKKTYSLTTLAVRFFAFSFVFLVSFEGFSQREKLSKIAGATMGTRYHISYFALAKKPSMVKEKVDRRLVAINKAMSTYDPSSEISLFNHRVAPGEWFEVSSDTRIVLEESLRLASLTGGALDITIGSLVDLWGFGVDRGVAIPSKASVHGALARKKGFGLEVSSQGIKKSHAYKIDLSAIAKGFGVDEVARLLRGLSIESFMVEIGGEVYAEGHKFDKSPWRIGIQSPGLRGRFARVLALKGEGMATSGDYRNYREKGGKRYSHIIDPKTGYPITHRTASVTVLAKTAMEADGLSTALFVMGRKKGLIFANKHGIRAYFLDRKKDGSGFKEYESKPFKAFMAAKAAKAH